MRLHGAWQGTGLAVRRRARCHPGGGSGHDPVRGGNIRLDQATRGAPGHVE
ncbi:MAG: membrane protein insertion efficiency factor YidD [Nitrospirota bacterium]